MADRIPGVVIRGDGGQNLIGSERGAEIGDHSHPGAVGGSWGRRRGTILHPSGRFRILQVPRRDPGVLGERGCFGRCGLDHPFVWPDVIVTRFPFDRSSGHGHHTSSARLARETFHAAGDPQRFPEQLDRVEPWQAKRLFWNGWRLSEQEQAEAVKVDVGEFDPLLGASYSEIAAISRSMHKSQGFGAAGRRGTYNT